MALKATLFDVVGGLIVTPLNSIEYIFERHLPRSMQAPIPPPLALEPVAALFFARQSPSELRTEHGPYGIKRMLNAMDLVVDDPLGFVIEGIVDPLILIPCFVLDFLCIHPFEDGNGRMSRLLTLLLLYRAGYMVGRYVSVEKAIADTKDAYYDALAASDAGWHEGKNDPKPFIEYMLGVILSCYRDLERRISVVEVAGARSTSYDIVLNYAQGVVGPFSKREALEACPTLGSSSVESALKRLVDEGVLKRIGSGRKTRYVRADCEYDLSK